jgi:orotate phosphoribosyltransferase
MSKILDLLQSVGAIYTDDHFVYTSGKHGEVYINKDALYPHTEVTSQVCAELAKQCSHLNIDTVVAPALGGIILSQWLSYHLSQIKDKEICGVYAEKDPIKTFIIGRGYDKFVIGKNVLVVEDLTTTGGSVKKVVDTVREYGGKVVGVCVMVNRDKKLVTSKLFNAPLIVGAQIPAKAWDAEKCKLCQESKPINTQMGHGRKYVQSKIK